MNRPVKVEHHDPLVKAVSAALRDRCRVQPGGRMLVAVSGGADSVALLRVLCTLASRQEWQLTLAVGHVQHHLREEAEQDAAMVQALAQEQKLPYFRADLEMNGKRGNMESIARGLRYRELRAMAHAFDATCIAAAHHADDQLETLLMRMLRGTSVEGMRGMAWRRKLAASRDSVGDANSPDSARHPTPDTRHPLHLIRPLLATPRTELLRYLRDIQQPWHEDHTNADVTRVRARLRRDVLPVLRELKPDAAQRATLLADHLRQVARTLTDAVDVAADRVIRSGKDLTIDRTDARMLRTVVVSGLLRRLLIETGVNADRVSTRSLGPLIRAIRDTTGGSRSFDFTAQVKAIVTRDSIIIQRMK